MFDGEQRASEIEARGETVSPDEHDDEQARRFAIECAERALSTWETFRPGDTTLLDCLAVARGYLEDERLAPDTDSPRLSLSRAYYEAMKACDLPAMMGASEAAKTTEDPVFGMLACAGYAAKAVALACADDLLIHEAAAHCAVFAYRNVGPVYSANDERGYQIRRLDEIIGLADAA